MKAVDKTQLSLPLCLNGNLSITKPNMLKIEVLSAFKCQAKISAESFSICFSITMKPKSKFLGKRGGFCEKAVEKLSLLQEHTLPSASPCKFPGQSREFQLLGETSPQYNHCF